MINYAILLLLLHTCFFLTFWLTVLDFITIDMWKILTLTGMCFILFVLLELFLLFYFSLQYWSYFSIKCRLLVSFKDFFSFSMLFLLARALASSSKWKKVLCRFTDACRRETRLWHHLEWVDRCVEDGTRDEGNLGLVLTLWLLQVHAR